MSGVAKPLLWVGLYAIAMAYLESAVVVYLRRLYGISDLILSVPPFDPQIGAIELGREAATLVMLLAVGWVSGKKFQSRLGFAIFAFGLWDIFYYILAQGIHRVAANFIGSRPPLSDSTAVVGTCACARVDCPADGCWWRASGSE